MPWLVTMEWRDALFLHWRADAAALRAMIPPDLALDTYHDHAWVSIVAFRLAGARPRGLPPVAAIPTFNEINVRTYVRDHEKAGIWFFSLDATSRFAVRAARRGLHLPYIDARIATTWTDGRCAYQSERAWRGDASRFAAEVRFGGVARQAEIGSLDYWLAERYCFFSVDGRGRSMRGDIIHEPWPLYDATPLIHTNELLAAADIEPIVEVPLAHASPGVTTHAWPWHRAATS